MTKIIFALVIALTIFAMPVRAENQTSATRSAVRVEKLANVVDRLGEKIQGFFKFSGEDKVSYQRGILEKRFAEVEYVIDEGQGDLVEEVSSRYATYVGKFTNDLISKGSSSEKEKYREMYEAHLKILPKLRDHFPANSGLWLLMQHDINTVQIFSDKIKSP